MIGDESTHLACFDLTDASPGSLRRAISGETPVDDAERAKTKPDLEALTVLPPAEGSPYGLLLGLGSGSGPGGRDRAFAWDLEADGSLRGDPEEIDLGPLYSLLRERLEELNIEGAAVLGPQLCLFQRGNGSTGRNAIASLPLERVQGSIHGDRRIDVDEIDVLRSYELGDLDGVELCFSDATPLDDRLIVFTASAEADDGGILGSVIGLVAGDGEVTRLRTIDRRWKVEGVHATTDTGVVDLIFVCDQDDPGNPSPLLGASMPLDATFERSA